MSTTIVSTTAELLSALAGATGGETFALAPGRYDGMTVANLAFATPVTITSADPEARAVFDQTVRVRDSAGLVFEGVDVKLAAVPNAPWDPVFALDRVDRITVRDVRFEGAVPDAETGIALTQYGTPGIGERPVEGLPWGNGVSVFTGSNLVFEQIEVSHVVNALSLTDTETVRVTQGHFHHMRADGIKLGNNIDTVIEHSLFHSAHMLIPPNALIRADHSDFIQAHVLTHPVGIDGLVLRGNVFAKGDGAPGQTLLAALTLFEPKADTLGFENIEVYDNLLVTAHLWGFGWRDAQGLELHHNTLMPARDDPLFYNVALGYPTVVIGASNPDPGFGDAPRDIHIHSNRLIGRDQNAVLYLNDDTRQPPENVVIEDNPVWSPDPAAGNWWGTEYPDAVGALVPTAAAARVGEGDAGVRALDPWLVAWLNDPGDTLDPPIEGGDAGDLLQAGPGGEVLIGHGGPDTLLGGTGVDTLHGGPGDDTMTGGAGADVFSIRPGMDEEDRITDLNFDEHDYIHFVTGFGRSFFNDATDPGNVLPLAHDGSGGYITERADLVEVVAHARVTATATGPDTTTLGFDLDGDGTVDWQLRLDGITGIGEDRAAAEPIRGGSGPDLLTGTAGADRLAAGPGQDTLTGGDGADIFQLDAAEAAEGADTITDLDFAAGDRLEFLGLGTAESVQVVDSLGALGQLGATGTAALRAAGGHTDLLFDRDGDGMAEWTLRLEGVSAAAPQPALADEPSPVDAGTLSLAELRVAHVDPLVLELMGDLG